MPEFRELTLADKPAIDRIINRLQTEASDLTFTNLFMWRKTYGLRVAHLPEIDFWVLYAKPTRWKQRFFMTPLGDWSDSQKVIEALRIMREKVKKEEVPFMLLAGILQQLDPSLQLEADRNTFDYVYETGALINLAGRNLHAKRNHLNKFERKYIWEYQPCSPELVESCLTVEKEWFRLRDQEGNPLGNEEEAMLETLSNFRVLGVTGGIIRIDGQIQAMSIGEQLNNHMAVIHIEKANTAFEGIYVAINQQFAANQWRELPYINREEDMGIDGLRQSKLSYRPAKMVEKFIVTET
jgi:hypothetical protein